MKKIILLCILFLCLIGGYFILQNEHVYYFFLHTYSNEDFHIESVLSHTDYNHNHKDDYLDLVEAARKQAILHPTYKSQYYQGGYPKEDEGVCTDLIWRAFDYVGIDLKQKVDQDIKYYPSLYKRVDERDPNIDFRRVPNLKVYFSRYSDSLTLDLKEIKEWQAGDIVVFSNSHIGIISNYRNKEGIPYLIHHASNKQRHMEEDVLVSLNKKKPITGHYRYRF